MKLQAILYIIAAIVATVHGSPVSIAMQVPINRAYSYLVNLATCQSLVKGTHATDRQYCIALARETKPPDYNHPDLTFV